MPFLVEVELQVEPFLFFDVRSFAQQGRDACGMEAPNVVSTARMIIGIKAEGRQPSADSVVGQRQ